MYADALLWWQRPRTLEDCTVHSPVSLSSLGLTVPTSKPSLSSAPLSFAFQAIRESSMVRFTAQHAALPPSVSCELPAPQAASLSHQSLESGARGLVLTKE